VRLISKEPEQGAAFADTQPSGAMKRRVPENDRVRMFACGCESSRLARIPRKPWMRLLPYLRLYKCRDCGVRVLRPRLKQDSYLVHGYLPAFYRRNAPTQRVKRAAPVVQVVLESGFGRQLLMLGTALRTGERQPQFAETRPM
jgi:hypothetical protein